MKTEFLKELGLEQEQIDKIMAENGKDIAAEKAKTTKAEGERDNYKSQLDTTKESLGKFDGVDVEALKKQITDLQSDLKKKDEEYTAKEAERAFNDTLSGAITAAGGKNAKAIMAILLRHPKTRVLTLRQQSKLFGSLIPICSAQKSHTKTQSGEPEVAKAAIPLISPL